MTSTTSMTRKTRRTLAHIDADAPARVRRPRTDIVPDDTVLRVPDFHEGGFAVFIGVEATVLVDEGVLAHLDTVLPTGGIKARTGHFPVEAGIVVQPHTGRLTHPAYGRRHHEAQAAWRLAQDTLMGGA